MADDNQPSQWSATAASNSTVGGGTSIAENCNMSNLNNGERAIMAGVAGALTFSTASGGDTYAATFSPAIDALTSNFLYCVNFTSSNTSTSPTLNLNSIGAKNIKDVTGASLSVGALNGYQILGFDGTSFRTANSAPVIAEGSFTPVLAGSTTAGTQSYTTQLGKYIKTGNLVFYQARVELSALDAATSGNVQINGLPFTSSSNAVNAPGGTRWSNITLTGGNTYVEAEVENNSTHLILIQGGSGISASNVQATALSATSTVFAAGTYRIN